MNDFYTRKFYQEDLSSYFLVKYLQEPVIDSSVATLLKNHDITTDIEFQNKEVPRRIKFYGQYFERGYTEDRRVYVSFISEEMGYGAFADVYIPAWTIIGEYTGVITDCALATDYAWTYNSAPANQEGGVHKIRLNARNSGNLLRFVNHSDYPNCSVVHVPYKNIWRTVYISNRAIMPGEELYVYYGDTYWEKRNKLE